MAWFVIVGSRVSDVSPCGEVHCRLQFILAIQRSHTQPVPLLQAVPKETTSKTKEEKNKEEKSRESETQEQVLALGRPKITSQGLILQARQYQKASIMRYSFFYFL